MAKNALRAIILSLLVIGVYIAIRFQPKYAVPVMIALVHDILITAGVYSLSEREVTSATVAAFLTILGYSMYDTVIVFDRIRENEPRLPRAAFSQIVNRSMSEVLTRSLITGLSTVFLVGVLLIFGGETLKDFAFAMMIGIASGTYSSIFIAGPVLSAWKEREPAYKARHDHIEEMMGYVPAFPEDNVVAKVDGEDEGAAASTGPALPESPQPAAPVATAPEPEPTPPAQSPTSAPGRPRRGRWRRSAGASGRAARRCGHRGKRVGGYAAAAEAGEAAAAGPAEAKAREASLMAALVWFTVGLSLWHFTVFVPDRFWGGIVGALLGAITGAMITGALAHIGSGNGIGDTDILTVLVAIPGALIGMAIVYAIGARAEQAESAEPA